MSTSEKIAWVLVAILGLWTVFSIIYIYALKKLDKSREECENLLRKQRDDLKEIVNIYRTATGKEALK